MGCGWAGAGAGVISKTILFYFILLLYKYIIKNKIPVAVKAILTSLHSRSVLGRGIACS